MADLAGDLPGERSGQAVAVDGKAGDVGRLDPVAQEGQHVAEGGEAHGRLGRRIPEKADTGIGPEEAVVGALGAVRHVVPVEIGGGLQAEVREDPPEVVEEDGVRIARLGSNPRRERARGPAAAPATARRVNRSSPRWCAVPIIV